MAEPNYENLFKNLPGSYLVLEPSLRIVAASDAYLKATSTLRSDLVGHFLLDVFPRNHHYRSTDAIRDMRASIDRLLQSRVANSMAVQRDDIPRPESEGGGFETRYWSTSNSPILAPDGSVAYIIHGVENVTELVMLREQGREQARLTQELRDRADRLDAAAPAGAQLADAALPDGQSVRQVVDELAQRAIPSREIPIPADVEAPHILIVQDHPNVSAFLAESLGAHYWISRASSGREGIQKALLPDRPDLIIADVTLQDMSGSEMVGELRRHSTLEDTPIVMLTAQADDALRLQLLREGIQDYLLKPFSMDELLARVQSLLTRWKRTGQRLRQSEERYRTLFNSVDEGFCIVEMIFDDSGKAIDYLFLETNPSFEKQTGLVDVQGKRIRELAPDIEDHWLDIYGKVALAGEPVRFESHAEHLNRWFDTYAFRYGDRENRQVALLLADITQRKRTEEALLEADRRKDQFLALLAHELRNPLAPIRNAVQILRMSPAVNAPATQLLPMMERQLAHMARLLDDLLDVSRIANGMIELRKERMDVVQAVQTAVEANKPLIDSKGHQMSMSLPPHPIMLDADPVRLAQVVSNLLNNAAHYSKPGGRIHLSVETAGREVRVSVKDSGCGIRPGDLENIFGLFVQVGQPFGRREGGLGIGLSLVRTMVDLHGGRVHARSAGLGKGSEFIVRLPIAAEQAQKLPRSRAHAGSRS